MLTRTSGGITTTFLWDGRDYIRDLTREGQLPCFRRDGKQYSVASDTLGCVRLVTDSSGDVVFRRDYGAWGETLPGGFDNVRGGMPYGFVGGLGVRTDTDTGMIYMRQRWYDPSLQRFISRDQLHTQNRYDYAAGSPTVFVDVDGLEPVVPTQITRPQSQRVSFPYRAIGGRPGRGQDNTQPSVPSLPTNRSSLNGPTTESEWWMKANYPEAYENWRRRQSMEFPATPEPQVPKIEPVEPSDYSRPTYNQSYPHVDFIPTKLVKEFWAGYELTRRNRCHLAFARCKKQAEKLGQQQQKMGCGGPWSLRNSLLDLCKKWREECLKGYGPFVY